VPEGDRGAWVRVPVPLPPPGRTAGFEVAGTSLLLCNVDDVPYVIQGECPHARVALAPGVLRGCVLECPFHGGTLDVRDGSPVSPPIRVPAAVFAVREVEGRLQVQVGTP